MKGTEVSKIAKEALQGLDKQLVKAVRIVVAREERDLREVLDFSLDKSLVSNTRLACLAGIVDWERFRSIYSFDGFVIKAAVESEDEVFAAEDFRLLPFPTVFLNADLGNPKAEGCFFSVYPLDGKLTAVLNIRLANGKVMRTYAELGAPASAYLADQPAQAREAFQNTAIPYLRLARFLASRNAEMTRDAAASSYKGFSNKVPKGQAEAWRVSYRKGADFAPRSVPEVGGQPLLGRPAAPRLRTPKKMSVKAHRQRYWIVCPQDPGWYIRVWVDKKEKIVNPDAPGDLPAVERDVPL